MRALVVARAERDDARMERDHLRAEVEELIARLFKVEEVDRGEGFNA